MLERTAGADKWTDGRTDKWVETEKQIENNIDDQHSNDRKQDETPVRVASGFVSAQAI